MSDPPPAARAAVERTRRWLDAAVVGLRFCPFAKAPLDRGLARLAVCLSDDPREVYRSLADEIERLATVAPADIETTLLIVPNALLDFDDFNDFLGAADAALADLGLEGTLQIASFHPDYRFADAAPDAFSNATNRAPHPTLQLLREASVARAAATGPAAATIVAANLATLEALGADGWAALRRRWSC